MEEDDFKILTPGLKGTAGVPLWVRREWMSWRTMEWSRQSIGRRGEILTKDIYRCGFCGGTGLLSSGKDWKTMRLKY